MDEFEKYNPTSHDYHLGFTKKTPLGLGANNYGYYCYDCKKREGRQYKKPQDDEWYRYLSVYMPRSMWKYGYKNVEVHFCEDCANKLLSKQRKCPICRKEPITGYKCIYFWNQEEKS